MLKHAHFFILFILFSFPFCLSPSSLGTSPSPLHCRPPSPGLYFPPTGARLHSPHGVRNGGKGVTTHQVRVDPSIPTATSFSHAITGPAMPKVLENGCGQSARAPSFPEKLYLFSLSSFENKLFQRTSHLG